MSQYNNPIQFFTATILEWKHLLKKDIYKNIIIDSFEFLVRNNRVEIYGFVIMPNHIHLIWKINNNLKREDVQRDFMKYTAQQIKFDLQKFHPLVLEHFKVEAKDRQYQIWERNPLSIDILSRKVLEQKLHYIHQNPIQEKWNLIDLPENYRYSSASFYIENKKS
jgi:putative transposase